MHIVQSYAKIINFMGLPPAARKDPISTWRPYGIEAARFVEEAARSCYRAEGLQTELSYEQFLLSHFMGSGHTNMARFSFIVVEFMVDRGVAQEILRHLATLVGLHESQRYCNYSNEKKFGNSVGFVKPRDLTALQDQIWTRTMERGELGYFDLLAQGLKPQIAADALPRATCGKLTLGGGFQAWRHFALVRSTTECHPKLLDVTVAETGGLLSPDATEVQQSLLSQFKQVFPIFFDDIEPYGKYIENIKKVR